MEKNPQSEKKPIIITTHVSGFVTFIREQGVVGFAIGFILGGSISKVVASLVSDIINPLIGIVLGGTEGLAARAVTIGKATIFYGKFISTLIDFLILAAVVYFVFKGLGLEKLDKKKEKK